MVSKNTKPAPNPCDDCVERKQGSISNVWLWFAENKSRKTGSPNSSSKATITTQIKILSKSDKKQTDSPIELYKHNRNEHM